MTDEEMIDLVRALHTPHRQPDAQPLEPDEQGQERRQPISYAVCHGCPEYEDGGYRLWPCDTAEIVYTAEEIAAVPRRRNEGPVEVLVWDLGGAR